MKILKGITCITLVLLMATVVFGQKQKGNRKSHKEKIQTMKIGYITDNLDLTTVEAQQFWPVYNEFDAKMEETRRSLRKMHKKGASIDEMTDADVEKMILSINSMRQKELDTQKEYLNKFKSVLPIKKIAKLYKAEHGFKRELLKKLKVKREESHGEHSPLPHGGRH